MPKIGYKQTEEHKKKNHAVGVTSNAKGKHWRLSDEARKNISEGHKGLATWNKGLVNVLSEEHKRKIALGNKGILRSDIVCKRMSDARIKANLTKERHPKWIKDRTKLKKSDDRRLDVANRQWRAEVYARDNYCCRIKNNECLGRIEAHHILSWRDHPELRYEINNGITLCHAHHPKKYIDEKTLSPYFTSLIQNI